MAAMSEHEKTCTRCKTTKPIDEFGWCAGRKPGQRYRRSWCRACQAAYDAERRVAGGEEFRERERERQRIYARSPNGIARTTRSLKRHRAKHPERERARDILNKAVNRCDVTLTGVCEHCGSTERVECHHDDYSQPLRFRELCKARCHPAADKACRMRRGEWFPERMTAESQSDSHAKVQE